jgi:hypothetical protein
MKWTLHEWHRHSHPFWSLGGLGKGPRRRSLNHKTRLDANQSLPPTQQPNPITPTQLEPYQLLDYFSMVGDSADNVPGIPGIGPKTAQELLEEFESFEELWEFRDEVESPRLRKIIEENVEKARGWGGERLLLWMYVFVGRERGGGGGWEDCVVCVCVCHPALDGPSSHLYKYPRPVRCHNACHAMPHVSSHQHAPLQPTHPLPLHLHPPIPPIYTVPHVAPPDPAEEAVRPARHVPYAPRARARGKTGRLLREAPGTYVYVCAGSGRCTQVSGVCVCVWCFGPFHALYMRMNPPPPFPRFCMPCILISFPPAYIIQSMKPPNPDKTAAGSVRARQVHDRQGGGS